MVGGRGRKHGGGRELAFYGVVNGAFFVTLACWIWDEVLLEFEVKIMHAYVYMN